MDANKNFVWVTRSFLDYRVPVFAELDKLCCGKLTVIYNGDYVPQRVQDKLSDILGERAVALHGEKRIGPNVFSNSMANSSMRIPWQSGLLREIRKRHPDVLISDGFFQWTAACLWLRARYKIPHLMCYERTAHTERHAQWYRKLYRKLVLRYIDAVCCSGKLCGEYTQSLGVLKKKITYGHMVADVAGLQTSCSEISFVAREHTRKSHDLNGIVFLYVGQLIARKGIMELLNAWNRFVENQKIGTATLAVIGGGPDDEAVRKFCTKHSLGSVRLLGGIDYDKISDFYAAADCFVISTLEDNWSLVVPEAMACGLPILCSEYNGCWTELVHENLNGWVFDPLNNKNAVKALSAVLKDAERLKSMGNKSLEIIAEHTPQVAAKSVFDACSISFNWVNGNG